MVAPRDRLSLCVTWLTAVSKAVLPLLFEGSAVITGDHQWQWASHHQSVIYSHYWSQSVKVCFMVQLMPLGDCVGNPTFGLVGWRIYKIERNELFPLSILTNWGEVLLTWKLQFYGPLFSFVISLIPVYFLNQVIEGAVWTLPSPAAIRRGHRALKQ